MKEVPEPIFIKEKTMDIHSIFHDEYGNSVEITEELYVREENGIYYMPSGKGDEVMVPKLVATMFIADGIAVQK